MKKYIEICMRNKEHNITVPFEIAEQILTSDKQITLLREGDLWTGNIINKSEIVATHRDYDKEKDYAWEENKDKALGEGESVVNTEALGKLKGEMEKISNKFKI